MIPFSPELQMIYTFFLVETTKVFCIDTTKTLEQIFGTDFNFPPQIGHVIIWEISRNYEPFTQLQYNAGPIHLGSEKTYLLLTQKTTKMFTAYYWLGNGTTLKDKQVAAKYVILLTKFLEEVCRGEIILINIARETEGMELDSFQHTMKMFSKQAELRTRMNFFTNYLDNGFPLLRPNLYAVKGEKHSQIKKIPLSLGLQWLVQEDNCLILEVEYKVKDMLPINHFCGAATSSNLIKRSWLFSNTFPGYFTDTMISHPIENNKRSNDYKQFLEVLEDNGFYNHNEVDNSCDHKKNAAEFVIKRNQEISLFEVKSDCLKLNSRRPIHTSVFRWGSMGYLLDSKSVAGVFLVLANLRDINKRIKAIQLAEEYLNKTYPLSSGQIIKMRIIETKVHSHITDFKINLSDFPSLSGNPNDVLW